MHDCKATGLLILLSIKNITLSMVVGYLIPNPGRPVEMLLGKLCLTKSRRFWTVAYWLFCGDAGNAPPFALLFMSALHRVLAAVL